MSKIIFKSVNIENFLSVGKSPVRVDFKRGLNIITGVNHDKEDSKNGVGKSTIADAIYFCLFGTTIRELKKDEIVNNITGKGCCVTVEFDVINGSEKDEYIAVRKIGPTKFFLYRNSEDITKSSMPKTTEHVTSIIGNPDVFQNAVIMTVNGTVPFMFQKKVERRKFCEGLFNLDIFSKMLLEARQRHNSIKNSISVEEGKKSEIKKNLDFYVDEQKKEAKKTTDRQNLLMERRETNTTEIEKLKKSLVDVDESEIDSIKEEIDRLNEDKESCEERLTKNSQDIAVKTKEIEDEKTKIKNIKNMTSVCDKCDRPISEDDKASKIKEKTDNAKKMVASLEETLKKNKALKKEKNDLKKSIQDCESKILDIRNALLRNDKAEGKIKQYEGFNKQIETDLEDLSKDKDKFNNSIKDAQIRYHNVVEHLNKLDEQDSVLQSVKYVVSEEGVKSFIVKKMLKMLNGKLAYYIKKLEAPCRFKFNEYFEEQIINERGDECSYNNFSSGEQKRIDLALLFTFMDIRRLQGNTSINILFFDEILDTSLDDKGIKCFFDILNERVEKYGEAVYIITHRDAAIKSATADIVFLEKENGLTKVGKYESKV